MAFGKEFWCWWNESLEILTDTFMNIDIRGVFLEGSLQGVFEMLPLSTSHLSAFLELGEDDLLWLSEPGHPKHMASPVDLVSDDHGLDAGAITCFKDAE
eukprot:g36950.t1